MLSKRLLLSIYFFVFLICGLQGEVDFYNIENGNVLKSNTGQYTYLYQGKYYKPVKTEEDAVRLDNFWKLYTMPKGGYALGNQESVDLNAIFPRAVPIHHYESLKNKVDGFNELISKKKLIEFTEKDHKLYYQMLHSKKNLLEFHQSVSSRSV